MNGIAWIILGFLAGAIAKLIYPGHEAGGLLAAILLGMGGALLGGALLSLLLTGTLQLAATGLSFPGMIVAVVGAFIALALWGWIAQRV